MNEIYRFDVRPLVYIFGSLCYEINLSHQRLLCVSPTLTLTL
jgi:hypothetical protein